MLVVLGVGGQFPKITQKQGRLSHAPLRNPTLLWHVSSHGLRGPETVACLLLPLQCHSCLKA